MCLSAKAKTRQPLSLTGRALKLLALREHSRLELERKLARYSEDAAEIERLLDHFEQRGWLSEARLVAQTVSSRRRRLGTQRICAELRGKGVSDDAIAAVLPAMRAGEVEVARDVWSKKFGVPALSAADRARQIRFLQGRGFDFDTIRKVLGGRDE